MRIDVDQILRDKSPALARYLPGFAKGYLRHIIHQKELNSYLESYSHLPSVEFIRASLRQMEIGYSIDGLERLNPKGRYVFASNHPFGGLDGVMLADKVEGYFGDVRVVVNDILMNIEPMRSIFIPINKHGSQSVEYARLYNEAFDSDVPIITFPAGLCSRRIDGQVKDLPWKSSFIRQAVATKRDVVPVFFTGELSSFFYRLSNIRKRLGIKANIEMLYLVNEMFKQQGHSFEIKVGEPISWRSLSEMSANKGCEEVHRKVYDLLK